MRAISTILLALTLSFGGLLAGEQRDGHAAAEWHAVHSAVVPGQILLTAVRIKPDKGWHSYWVNPGEGGMKTSIELKLPPGWTASEPDFPVPHRFSSMGLDSIGYEKEHFIFVPVQVPDDAAAGPVQLAAEVGWLTCDEESCIPGSVDLVLPLEVVKDAAENSPDAEKLLEIYKSMPRPSDWPATIAVGEAGITITITLPEAMAGEMPLKGADLFVAAETIVAAASKPQWTIDGNRASAVLKKSEFFEKLPAEVTLLVTGGGLDGPKFLTARP